MPDLSIPRFQQTTANALDGAKLRLDSTGEMSTGKRSWLGRVVRFIAGPTKADVAANKQIMSGLLSQLKAKYGDAVGVKAFLAGHAGARLNESGNVVVNVGKPLTARQVRDAITYAEAKVAKHAQQDLANRADRFAPGTDRFKALLQEKGLRPSDLGDAQAKYFTSRLRDDVAARAVRDGAPPDTGTVKKLASKLLDHTMALGEKGASRANDGYKAVDRLCGDVAMGLAGAGAERPDRLPKPSGSDAEGLASLLNELLDSGEQLLGDLMRGDMGMPGGDDLQRPVPEAAQRAFAKLSRGEARALLDQALAPDGPGRKLAVLLEIATADKGVKTDRYQMAAAADLARANMVVLGALAERAGLPGLADRLDEQMGQVGKALRVPSGGTDVTKLELSAEVLRTAGIGDATGMPAMLREVMAAIDSRAQVIQRAEEQELRELDEQMTS